MGVVASALFFLFMFSGQIGLCDPYNGSCVKNFDSASGLLQIFLPVLFFSLITYKLRDEVFESWILFAKWWVLATIFLVLITPTQDQSMIPLDKEMVSFFSTGIFTLVSLALIAYKSFALRKKEN